jgi:predicted Zn-dependent protease with MMP-like domain
VLYKDLGTLEQLKDKYKNATSKIYNFNELSEDEKNAVNEAIKDINMAVSDFNINSFEIVDFLDPMLNGLFNSANGRIFIARKIINDFNKLRIALIHEITHSFGEDGAKSHEDAMCEIWAEMFAGLKNEHNKI